jgi:methylglutaconyl-CoA hydratase
VEEALFSLSETRLGLIPAVISPYVIAAIGERAARRYFLTAERFSAGEAWRIGLVHETVEADELNGAVDEIAGALLECGPQALGACKEFIRTIKGRPIDKNLISETAERIAAIRSSDEGKEGIGAFLEKRAPKWVKKRA